MSQPTQWSRVLAAYTSFAARRPGWLLAAALTLVLLSLWFASSRLSVDARLEALLPQGTPEHRAREEAKRRVLNRAPLVLMVSSSEPALNRAVARQIARRLAAWPDARWVTRQRDLRYLLDRRLLYLPPKVLRSLADRFETRLEWENCRLNPLCATLEERPGLPTLKELRPHYHAFEQLAGSSAVDLSKPLQGEKLERLGELCSDNGQICLVKVLMKGEPDDLAYATAIIRRAERLLEAVTPARRPADFKMRVVGTYRYITTAQASAVKNLKETALLSFSLVLIIVMLQFRGWRAFALLFGPLIVGATWALAIVAWFDPKLNLMAAFTMAVLGGMGVDYGIHLTTKYGALRHQGLNVTDAAFATLRELGVSLPTAAITTGVGFVALIAGSFRGLTQMGWFAAIGIGAVVLAYALLFPALVVLFDRYLPERRPLTRSLPWPTRQPPRRGVIAIVLIGVVLAAAGARWGSNLGMEYDYDKLSDDAGDFGVDWNAADQVMRGNAVVMMADDPKQLEAAAADLREQSRREGSNIGWAVSLGLFVPPQQKQRLRQIARLRRIADSVSKKASGDLRRWIADFRSLLDPHEPISRANLPGWIKPLIGERNGDLGKIGIAYIRAPGRDARAMERLRDRLTGWSKRYPGVRFFAISAILGEVTAGLRQDAPVVLLWALCGIVLAVGLLGRSLLRVGTVLAALLLAAAVTSGLMVLLGWKIHLYNLAALPLVFGIGVDSAIYIVWSFGKRAEAQWSQVATTSRAVVGCAVTTMAGFGGMMIASNPGLRSFGQVAALGIGVSLLVNLVWLPALLLFLRKRTDAVDPPS